MRTKIGEKDDDNGRYIQNLSPNPRIIPHVTPRLPTSPPLSTRLPDRPPTPLVRRVILRVQSSKFPRELRTDESRKGYLMFGGLEGLGMIIHHPNEEEGSREEEEEGEEEMEKVGKRGRKEKKRI